MEVQLSNQPMEVTNIIHHVREMTVSPSRQGSMTIIASKKPNHVLITPKTI